MVVIQTILVFILVYLAIKLLAKWLMTKLFGYTMKRVRKYSGQQSGQRTDHGKNSPREGETSVYAKPLGRSRSSKKVGEYIDFEEID